MTMQPSCESRGGVVPVADRRSVDPVDRPEPHAYVTGEGPGVITQDGGPVEL